MSNIAYIRVSTEMQNSESQEFEIINYCNAAEIERNLISQRTKEALAARKESGVHLGRPSGCGAKVRKLCSRSSEIEQMLASGKSLTAVASEFKVHRNTLTRCRKCNYDIKMLSGNC